MVSPHDLLQGITPEMIEAERARRSLMRFIPFATPGYEEPRHLAPIISAMESNTKDLRLVISAPPQHTKTVSITSGLALRLLRNPDSRHAYITYSADRANEVSLQTQWLCDRIGLPHEGKLQMWGPPGRGSIRWTGVGGALTGGAVDGLMVIDDPVKNREEAESSVVRESTDAWFRSVALTRLHPGASCVVIATRWHEDDLSGRLIKRGWDYINLPAITPEGLALWPSQRPLEWLRTQERELGLYDWQSLYMGEPRPGGLRYFDPAHLSHYVRLPDSLSIAIGVDVATSDKATADYSAIVVLGKDAQNIYYVLHAERHQLPLPNFLPKLLEVQDRYPGAQKAWHVSGKEHDVAQWLRLQGADITSPQATKDKGTRAYEASKAWNKGNLRMPMANPTDPTKAVPWLHDLVNEMYVFTGSGKDRHDDMCDALSSAFSLLPEDATPNRQPYDPPDTHPAQHDRQFQAALNEARKRQQARDQGFMW